MTKNSVCCSTYLKNHTSYDCHLWCEHVNSYVQVFSSILKFWLSRLSGDWKGKKWPKITKISVCDISNHISYDLHLWYTRMYKRIISLGIFFIFFKILILGIISGDGKRTKNGPKWQKILSCSVSQEPYIIWLWFGYTWVKRWYLQ